MKPRYKRAREAIGVQLVLVSEKSGQHTFRVGTDSFGKDGTEKAEVQALV